jgi:hypothetical protein
MNGNHNSPAKAGVQSSIKNVDLRKDCRLFDKDWTPAFAGERRANPRPVDRDPGKAAGLAACPTALVLHNR